MKKAFSWITWYFKTYWLVLVVAVTMNIIFNGFIDRVDQGKLENAYIEGMSDGRSSIQIRDICFEPHYMGSEVDLKRNVQFDVIACKINLKEYKVEPLEKEGEVQSDKFQIEGRTQQI